LGGNYLGNSDKVTFFTRYAIARLRPRLLAWYDRNRRDLPWRRTRDPYAIWVSEIMLQQTRVAAVEERYQAFLRNFPTVQALAHAAEADVLTLWSGLGYYRRARMLHQAAKAVIEKFGGVMPKTAVELRALPGVGAYTSAAVASIAFGEAVAVVDGNVERVVQRLAGWGSDSSTGQAELARRTAQMANALLDPARPGDFNQSMMELGATLCLPRNPMCLACPLKEVCKTRGEHPVQVRARMRSEDAGYALVIRSGTRNREVLLEQRSPGQSVMPGMWELPTLRESKVADAQLLMSVRHAIMQVNYYVRIRTVFEEDAEELTVPSENRRWIRLHDLATLPLTGLARKVLLRAQLAELAPNPGLLQSAASDD
jgi:A/G-specific adenine glycosylase